MNWQFPLYEDVLQFRKEVGLDVSVSKKEKKN
jgi:hypothetical protein